MALAGLSQSAPALRPERHSVGSWLAFLWGSRDPEAPAQPDGPWPWPGTAFFVALESAGAEPSGGDIHLAGRCCPGDRSQFSHDRGVICAAERITIGNNVVVGANTAIVDTDFHLLDPEQRWLRPSDGKTAAIVIEDDVFIGMNCLILKGVTLGQGSVVGAGSVVTRDVPPRVIVAGNPARFVRELELGQTQS